jgi:hypothetical protein
MDSAILAVLKIDLVLLRTTQAQLEAFKTIND